MPSTRSMRPRRSRSDQVAVRFYYASGSPYAWRVWLALELKGIPYHRKTLSFDAGDLKTPEFGALNPRRRVPVLVDDDFALVESAVIVEYIEERIVDVEQKDGIKRCAHFDVSLGEWGVANHPSPQQSARRAR